MSDIIDAVVAELRSPRLGVLGLPLRRLADVARERHAIIRTYPWAKARPSMLWAVVDCYTGMLTDIDRLMLPILYDAAIPDEDGRFARFLFQGLVLFAHRDEPDPVLPLHPVIDLAQAGPIAEDELLRRLGEIRKRQWARADGAAAILRATTWTLSASDVARRTAARVIPGLDVQTLTDVRDRALDAVTDNVFASLRARGFLPALRARLRNNAGRGVRTASAAVGDAVRPRVLIDAMNEWRTLNVATLTLRALGVTDEPLHAATTLANRLVDDLRRAARKPVEDPVEPEDGSIHHAPTRVTVEHDRDSGLVTVEIRDEPDPSRPAPALSALEIAEMREVRRAISAVLQRDPALQRGYDVLRAKTDGVNVSKQARRRGSPVRQTLAGHRERFLRAVRIELGLQTGS